MNKELARYTARTAFRASADLNDLLPFLKENIDQEEYTLYLKAIASISAEIGIQILARIYSDYPSLEAEFDANIRQYGKLL